MYDGSMAVHVSSGSGALGFFILIVVVALCFLYIWSSSAAMELYYGLLGSEGKLDSRLLDLVKVSTKQGNSRVWPRICLYFLFLALFFHARLLSFLFYMFVSFLCRSYHY